jgi:hypothetical protein
MTPSGCLVSSDGSIPRARPAPEDLSISGGLARWPSVAPVTVTWVKSSAADMALQSLVDAIMVSSMAKYVTRLCPVAECCSPIHCNLNTNKGLQAISDSETGRSGDRDWRRTTWNRRAPVRKASI